jgi:endonuclease/exonuclease/phosphatase family metal-dependent hydrolase
VTFADPILRVMTWNLWWRFGEWQRRQDGIIQLLRSSAPDIVGLQEVWATASENQAQILADILRMYVAWCPSPAPELFQRRLGDRGVVVGNAILSRWPITRTSKCVLPNGAGDTGRTALFALIATPSGAVPFFTTQFTSAIGHSAARCDQVRALARFVIDEIPESANPLVTGDFNAEPDSDEIRLLGGHKTPPPVPGLVLLDAWRYADPPTPGWTWDRLNPAVWSTGEPDARIDYIFLGYRLNNESAPRVRNAWLAGNEPVDGVWPSDHAAVVVELEMPGQARRPSSDRRSSSKKIVHADA